MEDLMDWPAWESRFTQFLHSQMGMDAAHDLGHVRRVVGNARRLAAAEGAELRVVLPAAWLHDCVLVPKSSAQRAQASQLAAATAVSYLHEVGYPAAYLPAIAHAIEAHSFTAGIAPRSREAQVVQDADRLDALGAVGIARAFMVGGALQRPLAHPTDPFCTQRQADDASATLDHFYTKLLGLAATMQTAAGRQEADRRTAFLHAFLAQLQSEIE